MTKPSVEDIERDFESSGEDTLRDFVEILIAENGEFKRRLMEARRQRDEAQREEASLGAQNAELVAALTALVTRLDEIHDDPAYKSVWAINQIHAGPYRGPTYVDALVEARAALAAGQPQGSGK